MPELRQQLITAACRTMTCGLNKGIAGNLSVRAEENGEAGFLVTPTGIPYAALEPADVVFMRFDGSASGRRKPSSEWRFHRDIYVARGEASAIVHAHSPFATTLACLRRDIPAYHYMIARFGGDTLPRGRSGGRFSDRTRSALRAILACLSAWRTGAA
jgi:L-fuculose-phosphate aldolase